MALGYTADMKKFLLVCPIFLVLLGGCVPTSVATDKTDVRLSQYEQVKVGMRQVSLPPLMGPDFELVTQESAGSTMKLFTWKNSDSSYAQVTVINNEVFSKTQSGLK